MALRYSGPSLQPITDAYTTDISESAFRLIEQENVDHYAATLLVQNEQYLGSNFGRALLGLRIKLFRPRAQVHAFILENAPYSRTISGLEAAAKKCFNAEVGDMLAANEATLIVQMRTPYRDWSKHEAELLDKRNSLVAATFPEQSSSGLLAAKLSSPLGYCRES